MDGGLLINLDIEERGIKMAKAMKVPVLIFESKDESELIMNGLHLIKDSNNYSQSKRKKIGEILNEIYKINQIFITTNNN